MMPLVQPLSPNAAHTLCRSSSRTDGVLHNIKVDDQSAARSPSLNTVGTHQHRPIVLANLRHHLCGSPSPHRDTEPAALKSP
jgi:hypothetical protein